MILEELIGSWVALVSNLLAQAPPIFRKNLQREDTSLTSAPNPEQEEAIDGLIHSEYEQEVPIEVPYYEDGTFVQIETDGMRNFFESFARSIKTNIGLMTAVVLILAALIVGLVFVDLNTDNVCTEWIHRNLNVSSHIKTVWKVGLSVKLLPLFSWFPVSIAMLWGFKEFKRNYFVGLFFCAFVPGSISCAYKIIMFHKLANYVVNIYRLPYNLLYVISIIWGAYFAARKFKKVNQETSYNVFRIFLVLSFGFLASIILSLVYSFIIIKYFKESEGKMKKAIIATLTPGIVFPLTAIVKYLAIRKSSKIIASDRAFVLCYYLRGGSIGLYRTMQSGFQDIWLFVSLSLLQGVSNVLSKATLNIRIRMWTFLVKCLNRMCCGSRLEVQPLNSPRIRRLNADLEIQNILFEYTTVILSQAYLAAYYAMSYHVPPLQIIKASIIRVAISMAIDFAFNIISVLIQIHCYNIPMQRVWVKYWRRHVSANAFIIVVFVSNFGTVLVSVFEHNKYSSTGYELKNCTTVF